MEGLTYRLRGHYEGDPGKYRELSELADWKAKDPIDRFERHLLGSGLATQAELDAITAAINAELDAEVDYALASPMPTPERAREGVYAG